MLQLQNLKASINDKSILNGLNLEINQGEVHAIMGPNGSGKSTLLKFIMQKISPEIGEVSLGKHNIILSYYQAC